ncbi:hypothetical protein DRQ09_03335 [candidate division KSB1 bacterium]|nr:MAG: hypothetical protein DRQ09_03335 [candidate division KSB1 bacterium]
MKRSSIFILIISIIFLILPLFINCSGSFGGKTSGRFRTNLGLVTSYDFNEKTFRILNKYQYDVVRTEQTPEEQYVETQWKDHLPYADEQELGVVASRTRIILRARPRTRSETREQTVKSQNMEELPVVGGGKVLAGLNRVEFVAEYMVQLQDNLEWQQIPMTKAVKKYLRRVADELKMEYVTGIRKF